MIGGKAGFIVWFRASPWPVAASLLTLALAVRLPQLKELPDLDEQANLVNHVSQPVSVIVRSYGAAQNHPLYTLAARAFWLIRPTLVATRIPALLAGLAAVLALWFWLRRETGPLPAAWAAVALAVSWPQVVYSSRARGYSMLVLGAIVASWLFQRALDRDRRRDWVAYGASVVLTVYAHLWGLFLLVGHGATVAIETAERCSFRLPTGEPGSAKLRQLVHFIQAAAAAMCLIGLLYAPMAEGILAMLAQERETPFWPELGRALVWNWDFGLPEADAALGVLGAVLVIASLADGTLRRDPLCRLGGIPIATTLGVVALVQPANFYARFLIFLVPLALILIAGMLRSFAALGSRGETKRRWCGRPTTLSNCLAGLAAALFAVSLALLGVGAATGTWDDAARRYGEFAWAALASGVLAWLCGGVSERGRKAYRLQLTVTTALVFLEVASAMIEIDRIGVGIGRAALSAMALVSALALIIWTVTGCHSLTPKSGEHAYLGERR